MEGYEALFVNEVPSDMECGICLFVVREPIQIMACGHRFCNYCFNKLITVPGERYLCSSFSEIFSCLIVMFFGY